MQYLDPFGCRLLFSRKNRGSLAVLSEMVSGSDFQYVFRALIETRFGDNQTIVTVLLEDHTALSLRLEFNSRC